MRNITNISKSREERDLEEKQMKAKKLQKQVLSTEEIVRKLAEECLLLQKDILIEVIFHFYDKLIEKLRN